MIPNSEALIWLWMPSQGIDSQAAVIGRGEPGGSSGKFRNGVNRPARVICVCTTIDGFRLSSEIDYPIVNTMVTVLALNQG